MGKVIFEIALALFVVWCCTHKQRVLAWENTAKEWAQTVIAWLLEDDEPKLMVILKATEDDE